MTTASERLARCDREQREISAQASSGEMPAWLVTLGLEDWEMEKRLIQEENTQEGS